MSGNQLFTNNAKTTVAGTGLTTGATTLTVADGSVFPSPSAGQFFLATLYKVSAGVESSHEIVKCTARSGNDLTIVRAQEGTPATAYNVGDHVELRLTAATAGQAVGVVKIPWSHTWAIGGEVKVPSGETDYIPHAYAPTLFTGQKCYVSAVRHQMHEGTSATVSLKKAAWGSGSWSNLSGFGGMTVNTTDSRTAPGDVELTQGDKLRPEVTGVSSTPHNMSFTVEGYYEIDLAAQA